MAPSSNSTENTTQAAQTAPSFLPTMEKTSIEEKNGEASTFFRPAYVGLTVGGPSLMLILKDTKWALVK
jgi:hypothetical protein